MSMSLFVFHHVWNKQIFQACCAVDYYITIFLVVSFDHRHFFLDLSKSVIGAITWIIWINYNFIITKFIIVFFLCIHLLIFDNVWIVDLVRWSLVELLYSFISPAQSGRALIELATLWFHDFSTNEVQSMNDWLLAQANSKFFSVK